MLCAEWPYLPTVIMTLDPGMNRPKASCLMDLFLPVCTIGSPRMYLTPPPARHPARHWTHTGKVGVVPALREGRGTRMGRGSIGTPKEKDVPTQCLLGRGVPHSDPWAQTTHVHLLQVNQNTPMLRTNPTEVRGKVVETEKGGHHPSSLQPGPELRKKTNQLKILRK